MHHYQKKIVDFLIKIIKFFQLWKDPRDKYDDERGSMALHFMVVVSTVLMVFFMVMDGYYMGKKNIFFSNKVICCFEVKVKSQAFSLNQEVKSRELNSEEANSLFGRTSYYDYSLLKEIPFTFTGLFDIETDELIAVKERLDENYFLISTYDKVTIDLPEKIKMKESSTINNIPIIGWYYMDEDNFPQFNLYFKQGDKVIYVYAPTDKERISKHEKFIMEIGESVFNRKKIDFKLVNFE